MSAMRMIGAWLCLAIAAVSGCCVHQCGMAGSEIAVGDDCGSCESCGPPCGGLFSPLHYMLSCGSGCGEVYWDEWLSDPPECCDPCDNCGNWIGPQDCCRWHGYPLHRRNLWGARYHSGSEHAAADGEIWHDGEVVVDESWSDEMVAPAKPMAPAEEEPQPAEEKQPPRAAKSRSVLRGASLPPRRVEPGSRRS